MKTNSILIWMLTNWLRAMCALIDTLFQFDHFYLCFYPELQIDLFFTRVSLSITIWQFCLWYFLWFQTIWNNSLIYSHAITVKSLHGFWYCIESSIKMNELFSSDSINVWTSSMLLLLLWFPTIFSISLVILDLFNAETHKHQSSVDDQVFRVCRSWNKNGIFFFSICSQTAGFIRWYTGEQSLRNWTILLKLLVWRGFYSFYCQVFQLNQVSTSLETHRIQMLYVQCQRLAMKMLSTDE